MSEVDDVLVEEIIPLILECPHDDEVEYAEKIIALVKASQPDHSELIEALQRIANMSKDYVGCGGVDASWYFACQKIALKALKGDKP